jgi:hypothetical protein
MLYHASWILLLRPTLITPPTARAQDDSLKSCHHHSSHAHRITAIFDETFGSSKMSYIAMYCAFVAA